MSASILFEPVKPGRSLGVSAPSSFLAALERLGVQLPAVVDASIVPRLEGLRAGLTHEHTAIERLIEAIEQYESVRVWAEY